MHSFPWNFLDYFPLFELSLPLTPPFEFFIVVKNWVNPPHTYSLLIREGVRNFVLRWEADISKDFFKYAKI